MRNLALAVTICIAVTALAGDTQSLVDAAKAAKENRKKSTTKVITNADVKKAKAVVVRKPAVTTESAVPANSPVEEHKLSYREQLVRETQLTVLQTRVSDLEHELAVVEQSYYDEDDLDIRDRDIVKRFNDVKSKLDAAQKELNELDPPSVAHPSS
jgi:hypothetical protein